MYGLVIFQRNPTLRELMPGVLGSEVCAKSLLVACWSLQLLLLLLRRFIRLPYCRDGENQLYYMKVVSPSSMTRTSRAQLLISYFLPCLLHIEDLECSVDCKRSCSKSASWQECVQLFGPPFLGCFASFSYRKYKILCKNSCPYAFFC